MGACTGASDLKLKSENPSIPACEAKEVVKSLSKCTNMRT